MVKDIHIFKKTLTMPTSIHITFINNSNDANNSQIVIFQAVPEVLPANSASWKLQLNCPPGQTLEFDLPAITELHPFIAFSNGDSIYADRTATQEINFSGVQNANVVLSGGGNEPLQFSLQSISSDID